MIVVFGSINLDLIFPLPAIPAPGETLLAPAIRMEPGGKGANQAVAAARDGACVTMAGAVGRDALADDALALLRGSGVDCARILATEATTGCAAIFVDRAGRNAIGVGSGANLLARAEHVEDALLSPETTLICQMEVPADQTAALIGRAHGRGARVMLNLAPAAPIAPEALRAVDVLVVNEVEAAWLALRLAADASAPGLHSALGVTVIRTLGEQGVEAAGKDGAWRIAAPRIEAVDTTGAGDCFTGVLAAALDCRAPLEVALRRAVTAAGLCCARSGSQSSMPTRTEIGVALDRN
jgi:ribokinase